MEHLEKTQEIIRRNTASDVIKYKTKLGLLSDIPGYGKTSSMIGLIVRDKMEWDVRQPYEKIEQSTVCAGEITEQRFSRFGRLNCTLVLVSPNILVQWQAELAKTNLRVKTITRRIQCTELDTKQTDIVLIVPSMYNSLVSLKENCAWKRFIFDEPSNIKVVKMRKVTAGFYWLITSTPYEIRGIHNRSISFMNSLFQDWFTLSLIYDKLIIQNDPDFVRSSFCMPPTTFVSHICFMPVLNTVRDFVSENVTRMIEAGDIAGAIESLGGKTTDNLIDVIVERKEDEIKIINVEIALQELRRNADRIQTLRDKIQLLRKDIDKLKKRYEDRLSEPCGICLEKIDTPVLEPNCQNLFCGKCLFRWLRANRTCPMCRVEVDPATLACLSTSLDDRMDTDEKEIEPLIKPKNDTIVDIINSKPNGRFIIFSYSDWSFVQLIHFLAVKGITYIQPKGSATSISRSLERFRQGDIQVLLLNSQYNGAGMNLQEATDIILYHEMHEATKAQVIGRANRIGRTQPLVVHQLVV